ncbi:hypothetical protein GN244_ATG09728 [Phytophthora infestans]|uniref:DDE-1 domain-containing protein n=1 Tax=Phytophthora infestans TaxID=4787 RepID=A0A833WDD8_PHYIN|nr:hypothetical protein GN244_ATG09728 [Phytophthora infestans]
MNNMQKKHDIWRPYGLVECQHLVEAHFTNTPNLDKNILLFWDNFSGHWTPEPVKSTLRNYWTDRLRKQIVDHHALEGGARGTTNPIQHLVLRHPDVTTL